jgi:hypothetical protein
MMRDFSLLGSERLPVPKLLLYSGEPLHTEGLHRLLGCWSLSCTFVSRIQYRYFDMNQLSVSAWVQVPVLIICRFGMKKIPPIKPRKKPPYKHKKNIFKLFYWGLKILILTCNTWSLVLNGPVGPLRELPVCTSSTPSVPVLLFLCYVTG